MAVDPIPHEAFENCLATGHCEDLEARLLTWKFNTEVETVQSLGYIARRYYKVHDAWGPHAAPVFRAEVQDGMPDLWIFKNSGEYKGWTVCNTLRGAVSLKQVVAWINCRSLKKAGYDIKISKMNVRSFLTMCIPLGIRILSPYVS